MGKYSVFDLKGVPNSDLGKWRSIEFECILNTPAAMTEFVEFATANDYTDFITIKNDNSLHPNRKKGGIPKEICVSFIRTDDKIVRDVCRFLHPRAYVNQTCGTHIHIDMRGVKKELVAEYGRRLGICVPALKLLVAQSRRDNHTCYESVNSIDWGDRHAFINMRSYEKHKTIEVRGHAGTLNANKILNWIKICEKIISRVPPEKKFVKSPEVLIEHYKFGEDLTAFINKRVKELNDVPEHDAPVENAPPNVVVPPAAPIINPAILPFHLNQEASKSAKKNEKLRKLISQIRKVASKPVLSPDPNTYVEGDVYDEYGGSSGYWD